MKKTFRIFTIIFFATILSGMGGQPSEKTYEYLKLFGEVLERVKEYYVEEKSDQELIEAALQGMLSNLDPHSSFLNKENFEDMQTQTRGEFGGLGIEVTTENGLVKVVSPIDDTPAFRAGLQAGDYIIGIDGENIVGISLSDAVKKMRGKVGSPIDLTIRREKPEVKNFDVTIVRDMIKVQSVKWRLEGNIGYIRIRTFNEQTTLGLKKAFRFFDRKVGQKMSGIVLDLRNNPGGLLEESISVANAFLKHGEIVSTRGRDGRDSQRFRANEKMLTSIDLPVVVLINSGSASASEIVAGALQDHKRAVVMGTRSFGKGSVQTIMPLQNKSAMRLTTARYYTPSGRSIQGVGIEPDIHVEQARLEVIEDQGAHESDLKGFLGANDNNEGEDDLALTEEKDGASDEEAGDEEDNVEDRPYDYQLERALDLIQGLSIYKVAGVH